MEEYNDYYIAFLDVLGFKDMIEHKPCGEIVALYRSLKNTHIMQNYKNDGNDCIIEVKPEDINIKILSDSICIYIKSDIPGSLLELIFICMDFQHKMLELDSHVLIRGAISKGDLYSKGDVLFGPAYVKAYQMEEKSAVFPRIIITKAIIDEYNQLFPSSIIPVGFVRKEKDAFYSVDCFPMFSVIDHATDRIENLYKYILRKLDTTTDDSIRKKYLYLESRVLPLLNNDQNNERND